MKILPKVKDKSIYSINLPIRNIIPVFLTVLNSRLNSLRRILKAPLDAYPQKILKYINDSYFTSIK